MRLLVSGGRDFDDIDLLADTLAEFIGQDVHLFHGDADGLDKMAAAFGRAAGWKVTAVPIAKEDWKRLGKDAGPYRNSILLQKAQPVDIAIIFPGHNGTQDMLRKCIAAGVKVRTARRR